MRAEHVIEFSKIAVGVSKATHFIIVPLWALYLGYTIKQIGIILSTHILSYAFFIPIMTYFSGVFSRRFGSGMSLFFAHILEVFAYILIATGNYSLVIFGSAIGGIAEHMIYPSVVKTLGRSTVLRKSKTEIFVKSYLFEYISEGILIAIFGVLTIVETPRVVYLQIMSIVASFCIFSGILSLVYMRKHELETLREDRVKVVKFSSHEKTIAMAFVFYNVSVAMGVGMTVPYMPYLLKEYFRLELYQIAYIFTFVYILHAVIVYEIVYHAKRRGVLSMIAFLEAITASLFILMGFFSGNIYVFVLMYIIRSSLYMFITPLSATYKSRVFKRQVHDRAAAVIRSAWAFSNGIGRLIGAYALLGDVSLVFIGAGILGLLGIIGFLIFLMEVPGVLHMKHY
ncbi:MAG: MFS transporter [Euryarchaeota archaeon]|nr:MFS transporter [Euryarchaeota archaeon]